MRDGYDRRTFLKLSAAAGAGLIGTGCATKASTSRAAPVATGERRVRNVIFMVSDGMSMGVPSMAEPFSQLARGRGTHWYALRQDRDATWGFFETHALDSLVTDSAAAASAWGSGARVNNNAVNTLPDGTPLLPLAPLLKDHGIATGLVTTTTVTHATPAGFAAVQASRHDQALIAPQYLDTVEVLMGGGSRFFDPAARDDGRDLLQAYRDAGYTTWEHGRQLDLRIAPRRVLALFDTGHLPFVIDRREDDELRLRVPSLAKMTARALGVLGQRDGGFLLQVEGGRVDHGAHNNDIAGTLWEQLDFDDAVGVALDYVRQRDDTLLVITSDHGNANPGLNGTGAGYARSTAVFESIAGIRASFTAIGRLLREGQGAAHTHDVIRTWTGLDVTKAEAQAVSDAMAGDMSGEIAMQQQNVAAMLGQVLSNHTGVGWTGVSHTQDWTVITALGPGREHFHGIIKNTQAFDAITALFGMKFANPKMVAATAQRLADEPTDVPHTPHWV